MSYLIQKIVGPFKYYGHSHRSKSLGWVLTWHGLKNNGTPFIDKSLAEDHLDMRISEMKEGDNSKVEIIKI